MDGMVTKSCRVRRAEAKDIEDVFLMIHELDGFHRRSPGSELSIEDLIRDGGLDGGKESFQCFVVETPQVEDSRSRTKLIGFALCHFSYSISRGKSYFLQSFFLKEEFRNKGVGKKLFIEIVRNAKASGCKHLDFNVIGWNPARKFYHHMGAKDLTELDDWHLYRLNI